jgi:hypothetical protein
MPDYYLLFNLITFENGRQIQFTSQGDIPSHVHFRLIDKEEDYDLTEFNKILEEIHIPYHYDEFGFIMINCKSKKKTMIHLDLRKATKHSNSSVGPIGQYVNLYLDLNCRITKILTTNKKKILTRIKKNRIYRFISDIPEAIFSFGLIGLVMLCLYFFEKPEGFVHNHFPGLFLDISVFGILIVVFNKISEKKKDIKRWKEEIDDYRYWKGPEATHRIIGILTRLNNKGITRINLDHCSLLHGMMQKINLRQAHLWSTELIHTSLDQANFEEAIMGYADLQGSLLWWANFRRAYLFSACFNNTDLSRVNFCGAYLEEATFVNAKLYYSKLQGANLLKTSFKDADLEGVELDSPIEAAIRQLSVVETLHGTKNLDSELLERIKIEYPYLLEKQQ